MSKKMRLLQLPLQPLRRLLLRRAAIIAHGDDVVTCEDVSRGGLCFKSRKPYAERFKVEVAAPYTPGMQNFFTPAEIVHVQELKDEKKFRCGVAYLKSGR